ncbi:class I SAM-dependent methyltransferase [Streptomyces sp. NPDC048172]|uniref:class I SAM-dependent methyltransferase n=1 Tax=Streptomyces sp. NPDC048172 TaxID=3365505 RepID=UPI003719A447
MTGQTDAGDVFTAGAREFHAWSEGLWDPIGRATAEAAAPRTGQRVLDACCGAGASALPAARAVGPAGVVDGVDLSAGLIALARRRAEEEGQHHLRFHQDDVTTWPRRDLPYDIAQCALGLFFLPDMEAGARTLMGHLRPGGRLVLTVWENGALGAWGAAFKEAVESEREWPSDPELPRRLGLIDTVPAFRSWLGALGLREVRVEQHGVPAPFTPSSAWQLVMGSGIRQVLDGMEPAAVERVRARFQERLGAGSDSDLDVRILVGAGSA